MALSVPEAGYSVGASAASQAYFTIMLLTSPASYSADASSVSVQPVKNIPPHSASEKVWPLPEKPAPVLTSQPSSS